MILGPRRAAGRSLGCSLPTGHEASRRKGGRRSSRSRRGGNHGQFRLRARAFPATRGICDRLVERPGVHIGVSSVGYDSRP